MGFPAATNNRNIIFSICPDLFRSFVFHKSEVALIIRSTALIGQISDRLWMHHIPLQLTRSSGAQSACCSDCFASESSPIKELPTSAPRLFVYSLLLTELFCVITLSLGSLGTFFLSFLFFPCFEQCSSLLCWMHEMEKTSAEDDCVDSGAETGGWVKWMNVISSDFIAVCTHIRLTLFVCYVGLQVLSIYLSIYLPYSTTICRDSCFILAWCSYL